MVKDLARATGHSVYTVEHYVRVGLMKEVARSPYTQYRFFDPASVSRLNRIRRLRKQGKRLDEIRSIIGK